MYLRTPKRYQVGHKRRHMFSLKWLWLWILTPLVIGAGWLIYQERDTLGPPVRDFISDTVDNASGGLATMIAPTALPTTDPADHIIRADNAWAQGAIEQAVTEYGAAVSGSPNDTRVHYRLTYGLIIEGQFQEALTAAENAVTANPFSSDMWAVRALALSRNQRFPEAVASGMQALSLDPNNATALAFMSETYLDAELPALAEERANQAVEANPDSAEAHFARGRWNHESSFVNADALQDFQAAHDLAPNLPQVLVEMAWTNWAEQNYDLSIDELEQVVESNANNLDALYALGYIQYQVNGDADKAEDYFNRCLQVDTQNIDCLNSLAGIKSITDLAAAAVLYQRIIDAGTDVPVYYLRAGRTYAELDDCRKAVPLLRTGYTLEQEQDEPTVDRMAALQEYLSQCNAPFAPLSAQATDQGPLLIPLDGDSSN
ncbi:MAG: tetratricopeptide repeat protein [Chloroflexota bacterium]